MRIDEIRIKNNDLTLLFDETKFEAVLEKVLKYIREQNCKYYYFLCDDDFGNHDLSPYYNDYPALAERRDLDCFRINPKHIDNITFMYKIMSQYHYSCLYVNNDPDFLRFYNPRYRVQKLPKDSGYIVDTDISTEYISIRKALDLPDWDITEIGVEALNGVNYQKMESQISAYNLNNIEELQSVKVLVSELNDTYRRKIIDFILNEAEKLNKKLVQIILEIDGGFNLTFTVNDEHFLWFSIQDPTLKITIYEYEYYWDTKLSRFRLEEEIFSFLKKIFFGDYWIERVETDTGEIVRSSLNLGKNRNIMQYYLASDKKNGLFRHLIESEGINLYK